MNAYVENKMRPAVIAWLALRNMTPCFEVISGGGGYCDIIGVRFDQRIGRRIPSIMGIVAIELKQDDVAGVLRQCESNRYRVSECWAAMPAERITRMRDATRQKFLDAGVGLLSVSGENAFENLQPRLSGVSSESMRLALWRRRDEWQKAFREVLSPNPPTNQPRQHYTAPTVSRPSQ